MQRLLTELKFYQSYSFAQGIQNIVYNTFEYVRGLDEFYGDDKHLNYVQPFQKYSVLHNFIEFVVEQTIHDENCRYFNLEKRIKDIKRFETIPQAIDQMKLKLLPIEEALIFYEISHESFITWLKSKGKNTFNEVNDDDIYFYLEDLTLSGEYESLVFSIVQEVFFILFQNRKFLLEFNQMMAIESYEICERDEEFLQYFADSGKLKRVLIPTWVKRAVFFRDRGMCVLCNCDLTGLINLENAENYDHIVPLAKGGLNDVTNIQLLCKTCNLKKLHYRIETSSNYQLWYPFTEIE